MPRYQETARVVAHRDLGAGYFVLDLEVPAIAAAAVDRPGSFMMLAVRPCEAKSTDPLLPRPFAFLTVAPPQVSLFCRVAGRGTALLARARPGDRFGAVGPLGRGFTPPADPSATAVFVAGGIGAAPFLHLAQTLPRGRRMLLFYGGRSRTDIHLADAFAAAGVEFAASTEDGSLGEKGLVTRLVERHLRTGEKSAWYACGPDKMMEAVARLVRPAPCQVSLEARMGCGIGVCRGCAVRLADGRYAEICVDGPVREALEVWA